MGAFPAPLTSSFPRPLFPFPPPLIPPPQAGPLKSSPSVALPPCARHPAEVIITSYSHHLRNNLK